MVVSTCLVWQVCVFKPKGYNIVNAPHGERTGCAEWFHLLWQLTPLPSPLLPLSQSSLAATFRRYTHTLVKPIGAARQMGLAVWMPWPSSPTLGQTLSPYFLFILSLGSKSDGD